MKWYVDDDDDDDDRCLQPNPGARPSLLHACKPLPGGLHTQGGIMMIVIEMPSGEHSGYFKTFDDELVICKEPPI